MHHTLADKMLLSYQILGVFIANLLSWIDGRGVFDALLKGVAWALGGLLVSVVYNYFKNKNQKTNKSENENP